LQCVKAKIIVVACFGISTMAIGGCNETGSKKVANGFARIADQACMCKAPACAEEVLKELVIFAKANKDSFLVGPESEMNAVENNAKRANACLLSTGINPQKFVEAMSEIAPTQPKVP